MEKYWQKRVGVMAGLAIAHDPIFGVGPHVLFKNGLETSVALKAEKSGTEKAQDPALEVTCGLTGDRALGLPRKQESKSWLST